MLEKLGMTMTTIRIIKEAGSFFIQSKVGISDKKLSWKAKGMLSYLLSKPDNWKPQVSDLINQSPGGKDQVYAILNELIRCGYIKRIITRNAQGRLLNNSYEVYEAAQANAKDQSYPLPDFPEMDYISPFRENPEVESKLLISPDLPFTENPDLENPDINNNELKNNEAAAAAIGKAESLHSIQHAAAFHNQFSSSCNMVNILPGAEPLINAKLTTTQIQKVKEAILELNSAIDRENQERLIDEVCHGLLEPNCFSKTGNNFHRKLKAITNSIRSGHWETPASVLQKNQQQKSMEMRALKKELDNAISQTSYCNEMIQYSQIHPNIDCTQIVLDKPKYEAKVKKLKEKIAKFNCCK